METKHIFYHIYQHNGAIEISWFENEDTPDEYRAHEVYQGYNIAEALKEWARSHGDVKFQAHRA